MHSIRTLAFAVTAACALAACGGGGSGGGGETGQNAGASEMGSGGPAGSSGGSTDAGSGSGGSTGTSPVPGQGGAAKGVWFGMIGHDTAARAMTQIVLGDGRHYLVYSRRDNLDKIGGFMWGQGGASSTNYASAPMWDLNIEGLAQNGEGQARGIPATLSSSYKGRDTMSGSIDYGSSGIKPYKLLSYYNTRYEGSGSIERLLVNGYQDVPGLHEASFVYPNKTRPGSAALNVSLKIDEQGNITTNYKGRPEDCDFSGKATPRSDVAAFDVVISFGPQAACPYPGQDLGGIGYFNESSKRFFMAVHNADQTAWTVLAKTL